MNGAVVAVIEDRVGIVERAATPWRAHGENQCYKPGRMRCSGSLATLAGLVLGLLSWSPSVAAEPGEPRWHSWRQRGGELWLDTSIEFNLSRQRGGSRAVAPDLWWGITDKTTVALVHSARSIARIDDIGGLCVETCAQRPRYAVGALATHEVFTRSPFSLSLLAAGLVRDIDPWKPALLLGGAGRWQRGRWSADTMPYLQLGLANTEQGNRATLVVPVRWWVQPTCHVALGIRSGVDGEFAIFADAYRVPLAALAAAQLNTRLALAFEVGFASLFGPQNTANQRFATITLQTRL